MKLTLYSFFRSSASHRVRIALNLKGIPHEMAFVHLDKEGGQNMKDWYRTINPHERVPALLIEDDERRDVLIQSMAILEWLPKDPISRARVRAVANIVNADMHPIMNMRVRNFLKNELKVAKADVDVRYYTRWINDGFGAIEAMIDAGPFAFGDAPTLADVFIIPQIFNARRFDMDLEAFPKVLDIERIAAAHEAFVKAEPRNQPDSE
jgi:maleylacetoacetate isomerase